MKVECDECATLLNRFNSYLQFISDSWYGPDHPMHGGRNDDARMREYGIHLDRHTLLMEETAKQKALNQQEADDEN